jgi:hypothetical protein
MKKLFKEKRMLMVFLLITIAVLFAIDDNTAEKGQTVVIGSDTCTIEYQNRWTGNFRITDKSGNASFVSPEQIIYASK